MNPLREENAAETRQDYYYGLFFVLSLAWFVFRFYLTLNFREFGDETEKFITAVMMNDGYRLYRDVFANHGPISYMFAQIVYSLTGAWTHAPYRVFQALLYLAFCLVIWYCPLLEKRRQKLLAAGLFLFVIGSLSAIWLGHMLLFHAVSGLLLGCFFLLVVLPTWVGIHPGRRRLAAGGAALALAGFNAVSNGVSIILALALWMFCLAAFGERERGWFWRSLSWSALGAITATATTLGYLYLWGDIKGFFVYHIYFNMEVYRLLISFSLLSPLIYLKNIILFNAQDTSLFVHNFIFILFVLTTVSWLSIIQHAQVGHGLTRDRVPSLSFATLLFCLSLVFLNSRGTMDFHAAGYFVTVIILFCAIFSYGFVRLRRPLIKKIALATVAGITLITVVSTFFQRDLCGGNKCNYFNILDNSRRIRAMPEAPICRLIQKIASEGDPIMSLIFRPDIYLFSRRKPASGQFYYLPAQAAYDRNPLWNYKIDLKSDLERTRPKVIFNDWWRVWNKYDPREYVPWLNDFLDKHYHRIDQMSLYIRKDVDIELLFESTAK
jgi:MFS family permease